MTAPAAVREEPTAAERSADGLRGAFSDYLARLRGGDVGSLPAVLGLLVLVTVFTILRPNTFTNSFNFANLIHQSAAVIVIAMGLVFVLLLGEIDLSAGFTAGTAAAVMGVAALEWNWPWWLAILACLATGAFIGMCIGLLVARLGIPSFVVTLAAFLGLQGVLLKVIGEGGTVAVRDPVLLAINNDDMPVWLGCRGQLRGAGTASSGRPPGQRLARGGDRGDHRQDRRAGGPARRRDVLPQR
jgi:D-xylose transport system permease protein